jgi:NADH:ubiquinone oxidoreductase subunit C
VPDSAWIRGGEWAQRAASLKDGGWWLADLCGVDRLGLEGGHGFRRGVAGGPRASDKGGGETAAPAGREGARFEVVCQFLHHERRERTIVHVSAEGDPPTVPSIVELWPGANFMEREAFDMFGIRFEGHPHLTRILMPDEWEGHPLRKDYGVGKVPVEFAPQPFLQIETPGQAPSSAEAGAGVDEFGQAGRAPHGFGGAGRGPAAVAEGESE